MSTSSDRPDRRRHAHPWEHLGELAARPEPVTSAIEVDVLDAVLVVEPGPEPEATPAIHYAVRITVPGSTDRLLADAGWRPRSWVPRSWGRVERVDVGSVR